MDGRENPFRRRTSFQLLDPLVLGVVQQVPGVGRVKALALLQHFCSIQQLCSSCAAPPRLSWSPSWARLQLCRSTTFSTVQQQLGAAGKNQ